jgi:hypothetical protein
VSDVHEQAERALRDMDRPLEPGDEKPMEIETAPDRARTFKGTGLARIRRDWPQAERQALAELEALAAGMIRDRFAVAFAVLERVNRHVQVPLSDPETGEVRCYEDGSPMWEKDELGVPVQDWGRLSDRDRRNLLGVMFTRMYEWELAAASIWADSMFAKAEWEERFSRGFRVMPGHEAAGRPTIEDRTQYGVSYAIEERYFAVFRASLSKRADAVVWSMKGMQRFLEGIGTP